jgi:SAM-dependent methyltransferase
VEASIRELAVAGRPLEILEAGCGTMWVLDLEGIPYSLTGLDINQHALERRKNQEQDLDRIILGDICSCPLEEGRYDVVYSAFVLEHVGSSAAMLENCLRALRPGGILILKIPDPASVRGFVTRATPHWVHLAYYRHIEKWADAGKPGFGPFPVRYDALTSRPGIHDYCRRRGATIKHEYGWHPRCYSRGLRAVLRSLAIALVHAGSLGRLSKRHSNLTFVIERGESFPSR